MVNKVILIGNVGKIDIRDINNKKVANISLATNESYKNKDGERVTQTEWHQLRMWEGLAILAEKYVKIGDQLYIEGKIQYKKIEKDNQIYNITEILVTQMKFNSKKSNTENQEEKEVNGNIADPEPTETDDLPF